MGTEGDLWGWKPLTLLIAALVITSPLLRLSRHAEESICSAPATSRVPPGVWTWVWTSPPAARQAAPPPRVTAASPHSCSGASATMTVETSWWWFSFVWALC